MRSICSPPRTRREEALKTALGAGTLLSSACADGVSGGNPEANQRDAYERRRTAQTEALREIRLTVEEGEVDVGGQIYRTSLYNGEFPGPIVRLPEGEAIQATVRNEGPAPTTIHWYGIPVPNAMDGMPGLTQEPIPPGGEFVYEFVASPAGSYMYHSHVGLQIDVGVCSANLAAAASLVHVPSTPTCSVCPCPCPHRLSGRRSEPTSYSDPPACAGVTQASGLALSPLSAS